MTPLRLISPNEQLIITINCIGIKLFFSKKPKKRPHQNRIVHTVFAEAIHISLNNKCLHFGRYMLSNHELPDIHHRNLNLCPIHPIQSHILYISVCIYIYRHTEWKSYCVITYHYHGRLWIDENLFICKLSSNDLQNVISDDNTNKVLDIWTNAYCYNNESILSKELYPSSWATETSKVTQRHYIVKMSGPLVIHPTLRDSIK
jgi:hypothetical protein